MIYGGSAENVKTTVGCVCELKFENKKRYSGLAENKKKSSPYLFFSNKKKRVSTHFTQPYTKIGNRLEHKNMQFTQC
jgi:hypothetical protein